MPNSIEFQINGLSELKLIAEQLLEKYGTNSVWAFEGQMGAGKTTLIQEVLRAMGIEDLEGSPTYSLVNEYISETGRPVFHFDLYRIENQEEAFNIGIEEMIYGEGLSLIEWPEIVKELLPMDTIWFKLSILEAGQTRLLSVQI
ncbi:MAG: tRNA (adenosine(37)-N6)-threonylcarbamoyltransferase complex ATPase subunit type 1 TsaE [Crocinitomicaceae bacterium]